MNNASTHIMNPYGDLEEARQYLEVIADLLSTENGSPQARRLAPQIHMLCGGANRALLDLIFQDNLEDLKTFASALFSDEHTSWEKGSLTGHEYLRLQILKTLNVLNTRLQSIHAMRRAPSVIRTAHVRSDVTGYSVSGGAVTAA